MVSRAITHSFGRLRSWFKARAVILMYHRIADLSSDPLALTVSPRNFADHLRCIQETCTPLSLSDMVKALQTNSLPRRAVAVTFDDGYANNFELALPLIEATNTPATIFVTTGGIDQQREFWWDELARILLQTPMLPEHLRLNIADQSYEWPIATAEERTKAFRMIHKLLRTMPGLEQELVLEGLAACVSAGQRQHDARPHYRAMTTGELTKLAQSRWIEVGAHTVSHPFLASLPPATQHSEIADSCERLSTILGKPIRFFSYPYGSFNQDTITIANQIGLEAAITTVRGQVGTGDNLLQLNRCTVLDWPVETFKRNLEDFFYDDN